MVRILVAPDAYAAALQPSNRLLHDSATLLRPMGIERALELLIVVPGRHADLLIGRYVCPVSATAATLVPDHMIHALIAFTLAAGLLTITPGLDTALVLRTGAVE